MIPGCVRLHFCRSHLRKVSPVPSVCLLVFRESRMAWSCLACEEPEVQPASSLQVLLTWQPEPSSALQDTSQEPPDCSELPEALPHALTQVFQPCTSFNALQCFPLTFQVNISHRSLVLKDSAIFSVLPVKKRRIRLQTDHRNAH